MNEQSNCERCKSIYIKSITSDHEYCGICLPLKKISPLSSQSRGKCQLSLNKPISKECQPESWGELPEYGAEQICKCASCEEVFNSLWAFDLHRTGKGLNKQCLEPSGMRRLGMSINARGRWISSEFNRGAA